MRTLLKVWEKSVRNQNSRTNKRINIPDICHFFTQTRFLENKIYTEERVNYDKRISRQNSVNRDLLDQANNKDQDHEKKGNYTLCVKAVYHWMGVKTTYSVKITHIV